MIKQLKDNKAMGNHTITAERVKHDEKTLKSYTHNKPYLIMGNTRVGRIETVFL